MKPATIFTLCLLLALVTFAGCEKQSSKTETPMPAAANPVSVPKAPAYTIPETVPDKFNVAFVYVGPVGDGGWTFAHDQGRKALAAALPDVSTTYIESVAEGAESEQVIRSLARKGFDLIVATSFGFMDACETVAKEFPAVKFLNVSGFKKNNTNFGNLFGEMESMKYLAGMIVGERARLDKATKIGYVAPLPIPEVIRLINAVALGIHQTCADCTLEVRWVNSWFDPVKEKEAAQSLLSAGADVVMTGNDTSGPVVAAGQAGKWSAGYNSDNACNADKEHCLTVPYWNWGVSYIRIVKAMQAGTWKPENDYPGAAEGNVGLLGFMEGQTPAPGVPESIIPRVQKVLKLMRDGSFTRFDIFIGPLKDNQGNIVLETGEKMTQEDVEGIKGIPGRPDCTVCMSFFVDGVVGAIPK